MHIYTIIKTTSVGDARLSVVGVAGWPVILTGRPAGRWRWAWSKWAWSTHATVSAGQEQTLSGTGARVYTAHGGWLGVVTGISAASTGGVLVNLKRQEVSADSKQCGRCEVRCYEWLCVVAWTSE